MEPYDEEKDKEFKRKYCLVILFIFDKKENDKQEFKLYLLNSQLHLTIK